MKNKNILIGSALISIFVITGAYYYTKTYSQKINIVSYKESDQINDRGYQITKYEDVNSKQWIDEDNVLVLKDIPENNEINTDVSKRILSIYNLNTKTYKDFNDIAVTAWDVGDISSDGKYVLYREEKNDEDESEHLSYYKINIIDISTGNIIKDIGSSTKNNITNYRWTANNNLFGFNSGYWEIIDVNGKMLKKGHTNSGDDYAGIIGINDIDDSTDKISGKLYYYKSVGEHEDDNCIEIYSLDIDSMKESLVCKVEKFTGYISMQNNILFSYYINDCKDSNGDEDKTFGFKVINKSGEVLQDIQLPKGNIDNMLQLSGNGERASFHNVCNYLSEERNTLNDSIKICNISNGNVKEIGKISELIDHEKDEEFYRINGPDEEGNISSNDLPGPSYGRMYWDKSGKSFFYTYKYTSKKDGKNHTDTYVVTFD